MTQDLRLKQKSKNIIIVAHPDDEVIWMGGTIMRFNEMNWTVLSLCRASDSDREPKFRKVCEELGVTGIITDVEDEDELTLDESVAIIKETIAQTVQDQKFDCIFTHGSNGEYGHEKHIAVHLAINELRKEKKLNTCEVYFFDYKKIDRKLLPMVPSDDAEYILELESEEYERKRKIVAEMYGYPYEGIDVNLCTNIEAFKK